MTGFAELALWQQVAVAGSAAAAGISGYSAYQQGQTAKQQAKAEAAWHAYNAKQAEKEAEAERKATEDEAIQQKKRADDLLAKKRVSYRGVTLQGSPLLDLENTAAELALENAWIREQGFRRASAHKSQSILDFTKSRTISKSAKGYSKAGTLSALGQTIGGAARTGYMYGTLKT